MNDDPKLPPQNVEAEACVLGAILLDNRALDIARDILQPEDFYLRKHQLTYRACCAVADRGESVDHVTVANQLTDIERTQIGGYAGIAEFVQTVPTASNVSYHCRIVKDKSQARAVAIVANDLFERAYAGDPASELIAEAEQALFRIGHGSRSRKFQALKQVLVETLNKIEELGKRGHHVTGIPTGLSELDRQTAGWQNSDLIIVAGRPSMGKTALALKSAWAAALAGVPVAIYSLEMSAQQLAMRLIAAASGVDVQAVRTGRLTAAGWHQVAAGVMQIEDLPILIDETPIASMAALCSSARRLCGEGKLGLLVIDYLQLMNLDDSRGDNRHRELGKITRGCKLLAKELSIPVILLSQLNRDLEKREDKRPILADLRESGSIEEDADLVAFTYRHEVYHDAPEFRGQAQVIIRKHRNGPTGEVDLRWVENLATFTDAQ